MADNERIERAISNREEIERRVTDAVAEVDELFPGYREHVGEIALNIIGLTMKHRTEPLDIDQQIFSSLERAGSWAAGQREESEGSK